MSRRRSFLSFLALIGFFLYAFVGPILVLFQAGGLPWWAYPLLYPILVIGFVVCSFFLLWPLGLGTLDSDKS